MDEKLQENQRVFELLFQLGQAYLEKGQYNEAIDKLSKLIELGEESASVYLNLSKAFMLKEQYDDTAINVFRKTLKFDPDNKVINVVLSKIYLNKNREDDEAYKIYQTALQYNPKNKNDILVKLIQIDYNRGNYEVAKIRAEEFLTSNPDHEQIIPLYVQIGWQQKLYEQITDTLREVYKKNRNPESLNWLILNYIKCYRDSAKNAPKFKLNDEDIKICNNYLQSFNQFDNLKSIYIYLTLKKIVIQLTSKNDHKPDSPVSEFELFLSDNSLSNIWEKGINKQVAANNSFQFTEEIWNRLHAISSNSSKINDNDNLPTNKTEATHNNILMLIQIDNHRQLTQSPKSEDIFSALDSSLVNSFEGSQLKKTSDGYIAFEESVSKAIKNAITIFRDTYSYHNKLKMQILIHSRNSDDLLDDLSVLFEVQQLQGDIFSDKLDASNGGIDLSQKICITAPIFQSLKTEASLQTDLLTTLTVPQTNLSMPIYEVIWEDPLDKLRSGIIKKISRFQIINEIYLNDTLNSFKAVDTFLERLVILKILRPDFRKQNRNKTAKDFFEGARKIGKFNHKNNTLIYDIGEDQGFLYISREYVEGSDLKLYLSEQQIVGWRHVIELCVNIGNMLHAAHQANIVHGKIKPSNIFFTESKEIKITDFMIPGFTTPIKDQPHPNLNSISYAATEQLENNIVDKRTDIYSVAVILYELLTGKNPFYANDKNQLLRNITTMKLPSISSQQRDIPTEIDYIIAKSLEKSPANRYQDMAQFVNALKPFLS